MGIDTIGTQIAKLRKEKGVTQEELAKFTQVSPQAVSKWENGGVPDAELLPKIADFFEVSIDGLFGRSMADFKGIGEALARHFEQTDREHRLEAAFEICWLIQRTLYGDVPNEQTELAGIRKEMPTPKQRRYSSLRLNEGFISVGLSEWLPYFLLAPEPKDVRAGLLDGMDYPALFADLADQDVFDALVFLYGRDAAKGFTPNLLVKHLSLAPEKASEIVALLQKYKLVRSTQIEMDDEMQEIFTFEPTPEFPALLLFARNMIEPPNSFFYFSGGREKPYFA